MGITYILIAGAFIALANYFLRRSIDAGGSTKAYLMIQLSLSFFLAILLNPVRTREYGWDSSIGYIGATSGLILGAMMFMLGKSLQSGPPGLTFAILNSSSVIPAILMALLFGAAYGHDYTLWNGIGSFFVILGLLWAGWGTGNGKDLKLWLLLIFGALACNTAFLVIMQWRAMLLKPELPAGPLLSFRIDASLCQWYMPVIFFTAAIVQFCIFLSTEKRVPRRKEFFYAVCGGLAFGLCTFFQIKATDVAGPLENAMLFPIFSVTIIVLCNIWGQWLYKEKVNWLANVVCLLGLICGTVDWHALRNI